MLMDLVVEFFFYTYIEYLCWWIDELKGLQPHNVLLVFLFSILGQKMRNFTAPNGSIVGSSDFLWV